MGLFNQISPIISILVFVASSIFCSNAAVPKFRLNSAHDMPAVGIGMGGFRTGGPPQGENVTHILRTAIDAGYRHIDTARGYHNEEAIGRVLNELIDEGKISREELFITTKIYWKTDNSTRSRAQALEHIRLSLEKLNTSYIDLMLVHYPSTPELDIEVWKGLEDAQNMGLVRSIGVSNFNSTLLQRLINKANVIPAVNQVESHPLLPQKQLQDFCSQYKIRLTAWSPLGAGGLVTYPNIVAIGEKYNKSAAQVMIRWHLQRGVAAIPKSTNEMRIRENFDVFNFQLTDQDMTALYMS